MGKMRVDFPGRIDCPTCPPGTPVVRHCRKNNRCNVYPCDKCERWYTTVWHYGVPSSKAFGKRWYLTCNRKIAAPISPSE